MTMTFVPSICPYCGTGCGVLYQTDGETIFATLPNRASPVNGSGLCLKGWSAHEHLHVRGRLTTPLIRQEYEGEGQFSPASWEEALDLVAGKLTNAVTEHGPDSVMVLSSARITNEENYLAQKFARVIIGTNNVDHCARLCHSASVAGLAATLGSGAMTNSLDDLETSQCVFIIGANTSESHPLIASRMMRAKAAGGKVIVADPRPTQLAGMADMFVQPIPGTDVALLNAMAGVIVREKLHPRDLADTTEDFEAFAAHVAAMTPEGAAAVTGIPSDDIVAFARVYATTPPAAICYAMGITQYASGTERVQACSNLALLTGNIGVPGGGINPLRGQNNVQGACDMGVLPNVLPGYRQVSDKAVREDVGAVWGAALSAEPGLTVTQLPGAILDGKIKALYIIGENPLMSDPDTNHLKEAFSRLSFLAVQDIFLTRTARMAHVVLPTAAAAEKAGTFTNTERRCSFMSKAVPPPGEALDDAAILCRLAKKMGYTWSYADSEDIFNEMRRVTPSYAGMTHARLGMRGLQWPCPTEDHPGTPILHTNGCARGKGRFMTLENKPPAEPTDAEYPLILSTGRNFAHYHTATMSGASKTLSREGGEVYVEMHPEDAAACEVTQGQLLRLVTRRGSVTAKLRIVPLIRKGVVFMPFHYEKGLANALTQNVTDPVCGIPEFKHCAVRVEHV